jgi:CheY-like chemotaxis protein
MPKILLVEDEPTNAEIISRFLRIKNHEVVCANDGPTGVSLAQTEHPDLILMDLRLPRIGDGQRATREIRALAGLETVPIVALTATCMPEEVEEMYQAGCNELVTKPIDLKKLLERITNLLTDGGK